MAKIPTDAQWEDLVSKIPVVALQSTDPGEGQALAANHFIGVYDA